MIAELDHVHIDFWDPLGLLESGPTRETLWERETGATPRFVWLE